MALYFDESFYLQTKLKQLEATGSKGPGDQPWTEATLRKAMTDIGLTPEQHYESFGRVEKVNPNAYFNESEYLSAKLKALQENPATASEWASKNANDLVKVMEDLNLTPAQHYERFGAFETRGDGTLLNPSNAFDANGYFAAKLAQMQAKGETLNGKPATQATVAEVVAAFKAAGISPTTHYESFGAKEANAQGVALVQTVPSEQRVANDGFRGTLGQNVPTNYNPASKPPAEATASAVTKPADVGGLASSSISPAVTPPAKAAPVPGDSNYVKPPAGLADTNANPVIAPTTKGNGSAATDCWATAKGDGTADLIRPDGQPGGTISLDPNNPSVIPPSTPTPTPPTPETPVIPPAPKDSNVAGTVAEVGDPAVNTLTLTGTAQHGEVTVTLDATAKIVTLAELGVTGKAPSAPAASTAEITAIDSKIVSTSTNKVVIDISKDTTGSVTKAHAYETPTTDTSYDVLKVSADTDIAAFTQDGTDFKGFEELRLTAGDYVTGTLKTISKYDNVSAVGATAAVTAKLGADVKNYTGSGEADTIFLTSAFNGKGTLDGGAGADTLTLEASLTIAAGATPAENLTIKNFETVTATAVSGAITANLGVGVNSYAGGSGADTINLIDGFNGVGTLDGGAGTDVLNIKTAVPVGADDAVLTIKDFETVNAVDVATGGVNAKLTGAVNSYTGSATAADNIVLVTGYTGSGTLSGGGTGVGDKLTIDVTGRTLTSVSNFADVEVKTGASHVVTATLGANVGNYTGGAGKDTITLGTGFNTKGTLDGGGTSDADELHIKVAVAGTVAATDLTIKNFETVTVDAAADVAVTANIGKGVNAYTGSSISTGAVDEITLITDFNGTGIFDGGKGEDKLHIGAVVAGAGITITSFETVNVTGSFYVKASLGAEVNDYTGGAGADVLTIGSGFNGKGVIDGKAGVNTLDIANAVTKNGSDVVTFKNFAITVSGSNANVEAKLGEGIDAYAGNGSGNDVLTLVTGFNGTGLFDGGTGTDSLTVSAGVTVDGLTIKNFDTVTATDATAVTATLDAGVTTYTGSAGVDTLILANGFQGTVTGGEGADSFTLGTGWAGSSSLTLGLAAGDSAAATAAGTTVACAGMDVVDFGGISTAAISFKVGGYSAENAGTAAANQWAVNALTASTATSLTPLTDNQAALYVGTYANGIFTLDGTGDSYLFLYDANDALNAESYEAVVLTGVATDESLTAGFTSGVITFTSAS